MDALFEHHKGSIRFRYRCIDRILLNAVIQPFQQPERVVGFFATYRAQYPVSRDVLRDIAGQARPRTIHNVGIGSIPWLYLQIIMSPDEPQEWPSA
jgi:hypothetical protein